MQPLIAPCILDPQEAMLDHNEEYVLNDYYATEGEENEVNHGGEETEVGDIVKDVIEWVSVDGGKAGKEGEIDVLIAIWIPEEAATQKCEAYEDRYDPCHCSCNDG